MKRLALFAALGALLLASYPAMAQTLVGSVSGKVTDEQGGAVPGASITLSGKTGDKTATSGTDGTYRFVAVDPGSYTLKIQLTGFRPQQRDEISVTLGKLTNVDFTLKIGGVTDTVEVVGEAPVVDVTSSATDNTLNQDFLFNLPISRTNAAVNTLNYFPGINSGSAYGGDSDSGNALMLDGVDTRDPEGGTAWTFFNYNLMEEVQVGGLGAPAEYGAFTGAFINTITKSGGNRYTGLFDINYTNDSDLLSTSNVTSEIKTQNPTLAEPALTRKLLDVTAQMGGPLIKDKLFFFASAQRYELNTDPTGPVTLRHEVSPRLNGKITYQPGPNDTFTGTLQYDSYNIIGRVPGSLRFVATQDITNREDAPEWVWLAQWRHLFGTNTFMEVKYTGWWGFFDLNPEVNKPGHLDENGTPTVSQGWFAYYDRGRHQVNASISHYAEAFGKHDLKFGVEVERSKVRDRYGYVNDIFYYDYGGAPYLAYSYGYDLAGKNHRESLFAQDSWKMGSRVTLNAGLRLDMNRGFHDPHEGQQDVGKVWDSKGLAPRVGLAWDVTGDNKTVLKGTFSQYYEGAFFTLWSIGVPGIRDFVLYDVSSCPSVSLPCPPSQRVEIDRTPATVAKVDPDVKHPRRDEFTVGLERAIGRDVRFALTGIWREGKNFVDDVFPTARWTPTTLTTAERPNFSARPITVYRWANPSDSQTNILITNPDGFQYLDPSGGVLGTASATQKYRGVMAVLTKRFSNRWQSQLSYVWSKAEGTVNNDGGSTGVGAVTRFFETPTLALVNADGKLSYDRTHEIKVYGSYQIPKVEVGLNLLVRSTSGRPYAAFQRFSSSQVNFSISSQGRQPLVETRGIRRRPWDTQVDVRFDKYFKLGGAKDQVSFYVDFRNLLNAHTITDVQNRLPSVSVTGIDTPIFFDAPNGIVAPRSIVLGGRFSF
jgi:Carboxypeptidase regulatory-like domain